jgi:16S rRNA A1518/A1519 N6-dimethyltransferase RsmA/KsgA/DIM1 with predicted DNA glycosylase/AP lyase activity
MMQKEVAEKIRIDAEKKSFLRWIVNFAYDVRSVKSVPARAFSPKPKVDSALVQFLPKTSLPQLDRTRLTILLERISMYKRKTLGKIWKMVGDDTSGIGLLLQKHHSEASNFFTSDIPDTASSQDILDQKILLAAGPEE